MIFNIFKICKHDWKLVYRIGGDIQNTAYKCTKCSKRKVTANGRCGKMSYKEMIELKMAQDRVIIAIKKAR